MALNLAQKKPLTEIEERAIVLFESQHIKIFPNIVYDIFSCGCVHQAGSGIGIPHGPHQIMSCPDCKEPVLTKYKKCSCGVGLIGKYLRPSKSGSCMSCYQKNRKTPKTNDLGWNKSNNSVPHKCAEDRMIESAHRISQYLDIEVVKPKDLHCIHARVCGSSCMAERGEDCSMFEEKEKTHLWY